jgi:hypothetical protein
VRDRRVGHDVGADHVQGECPLPDVEIAGSGFVRFPDPGVVDEDVEAAPGGNDVGDELVRLPGVPDVSGERDRFAAGGPHVADELVRGRIVRPIVDRDPRARGGEDLGGRPADPARRAGDERALPREVDRDRQSDAILRGRAGDQ